MSTPNTISLARVVAPEDIKIGSYLAVSQYVLEFARINCDEAIDRPPKMLRIGFLPFEDPVPLKVKTVCLPFVLVKRPTGEHEVIDTRRYRFCKLKRAFAKSCVKAMKPKAPATTPSFPY